jgi:hypothetical protein
MQKGTAHHWEVNARSTAGSSKTEEIRNREDKRRHTRPQGIVEQSQGRSGAGNWEELEEGCPTRTVPKRFIWPIDSVLAVNEYESARRQGAKRPNLASNWCSKWGNWPVAERQRVRADPDSWHQEIAALAWKESVTRSAEILGDFFPRRARKFAI